MRHFYSYGPVDCELHFCVPRTGLVDQCVDQIVGDVHKGGHYFTIWAPRQTGKTWLMRQVKTEIPKRYGETFAVFNFSLGNLRGMGEIEPHQAGQVPFPAAFRDILRSSLPGRPVVNSWPEFVALFDKETGLWERPLILLIDEVDTAPPLLLDILVGHFRELFLDRSNHLLHGLALVGVRAVLGIESQRGSPFNIQRALHVPNFTHEEVQSLFQQYQVESGQRVDPAVVDAVFRDTTGQPGLVCWFGELLTEKYNPGLSAPIDLETWQLVQHKARFVEPNNTIRNLIAKAQDPTYRQFLVELFTRSDIPFALHDPMLNYLYQHGIIDSETIRQRNGEYLEVCRFYSPFIQDTLYHALSAELVGTRMPILALNPLDDLADVFAPPAELDIPALLRRYEEYLARLRTKGLNPWKEQPRRQTDLHLIEAVGHFHLYAWLQSALGSRCAVSPEFPTGNGRVDLHLRCSDKRGIIEVKSFVNQYQAGEDRKQAARYAKRLGFSQVTLATFVPVEEESVLDKLSITEVIEGVTVTVVAIGWV